ncbi:MAG: PAS domain S-box protein [Spirochaetes bacterium]|nr:PAS domain S-box protein [Spirochaetota bacterium]
MNANENELCNWFFHCPFGVVICTHEGTIVAANPPAIDILEKKAENSIFGKNIVTYFQEENRTKITSLLEASRYSQEISHQTVVFRKDNKEHFLFVNAKGMWDDQLHQYVIIFSFVDITSEKKELNEIKLSEEKYRALVNLGGDAILVFDENAFVVEVNIKAMALFGYSRKEFVGKNIDELYEGELLQHHRMVFNEILTTGSARLELSHIVTRDKKIIPVNISGSVVEYNRQLFVQMIFRDITEQIKAEEEKNRLIAELNQIFSISAIGLCLVDESLTIIRTNSAYKNFFSNGLPIIGKKCFEIVKGNNCNESCCEIVRGKKMVEFELRMNQMERELNYYIVEVPFYNEKGEQTGILQSVTDITPLRTLERELIQLSERERRHVSQELHDGIGQILTGMSYLIEKLVRRMKAKESFQMKMLLDINELAKDALEKTRNLVRGLVPVFTAKEDLLSSIAHIAEETKRLYGIRVELELTGMPQYLEGNEMTQLYYIIKEAVHNSIKHSKATEITVQWEGDSNWYELSIFDNGKSDVKSLAHSSGMGLDIMKYRAGLIGAQFFCGFEENGFTVRVKKSYKIS